MLLLKINIYVPNTERIMTHWTCRRYGRETPNREEIHSEWRTYGDEEYHDGDGMSV